jgi:hypothetical protein
MFNTYKHAMLLILMSLSAVAQTPPVNVVIIKGIHTAYLPFSSIQSPVFEITNSRLHISVTDRKGNMLQINDIDIQKLKPGILPPSAFQTVVMMVNGETYTDDTDQNPRSLVEIICANNHPNTPITVGIKTTVLQNGKNHRVYATLSGIIPSYTYERTN